MVTTVVTGWAPAGWRHYAKTFVETFATRWPVEVGLIAYAEEPVHMVRGECRSVWEIPGALEFYARHRDVKSHNGRQQTPHWRPKDVRKLANGHAAWRWDAVRFFKQLIIPHQASLGLPDGDVLVWLDADVVTFDDVPGGFIEHLMGKADLCYLGRNEGSEIGFWAVRLNGSGRAFLGTVSDAYLTDWAFGLSQWHSAFVWDHVRKTAERAGLKATNLTPGGRDHVFVSRQSPLHTCLDHLKGSRKDYGHSPEHAIRWWERAGHRV